jgi:hypothetical protein
MAFLKIRRAIFVYFQWGFEKEDEGLLRLQNFHCKPDLYEEIMQQCNYSKIKSVFFMLQRLYVLFVHKCGVITFNINIVPKQQPY